MSFLGVRLGVPGNPLRTSSPVVPGVLAAGPGAFNFTGSAATLKRDLLLSAAAGAFLFTGQAATLTTSGRILAAGAGAFLFSGDTMTPIVDYKLPADAGAFLFTGQAAALTQTHLLPAAAGSFLFTGSAATLTKSGGLALHSAAHNTVTSGTTVTATITTTVPNTVIVFYAHCNVASPVTTSASDAAGLSWTRISATGFTPAGEVGELWYAKSTGLLTGDVITFDTVNPVSFANMIVGAFSGVNMSSPLDPNAGSAPTAFSTLLSFDTTNSNTVMVSHYNVDNNVEPAGTGWLLVDHSGFSMMQYKIVSSPQTGTSAPVGGSTYNERGAGVTFTA